MTQEKFDRYERRLNRIAMVFCMVAWIYLILYSLVRIVIY